MITKMNQHVKNQHYVTQFLLRYFSSDEEKKFIWAYDRDERFQNEIKNRPIRKVSSEDFFMTKLKIIELEAMSIASKR